MQPAKYAINGKTRLSKVNQKLQIQLARKLDLDFDKY